MVVLIFQVGVDRSQQPRQAEAEEDVHRVAPCDVPNGRVGVVSLQGGEPGRKRVRERGPECDKAYSRHHVWNADYAPEQARKLPYHVSQPRDGEDGHDKRGLPAPVRGRRDDEGKQELPAGRHKVQEEVRHARFFLHPKDVRGAARRERVPDLLPPSGCPKLEFKCAPPCQGSEHPAWASVDRGSFIADHVGHAVPYQLRAAGDLRELHVKDVAVLELLFPQEVDGDGLLGLAVLKGEGPFGVLIVDVCLGAPVDRLVDAGDGPVSAFDTLDVHGDLRLSRTVLVLVLGEHEHPRVVVVDDDDCGPGHVLPDHALLGVEQLDVKLLVGLVDVVVHDFHRNLRLGLVWLQDQRPLCMHVVRLRLCSSFNRLVLDSALLRKVCMVPEPRHRQLHLTARLEHCVLDALEADLGRVRFPEPVEAGGEDKAGRVPEAQVPLLDAVRRLRVRGDLDALQVALARHGVPGVQAVVGPAVLLGAAVRRLAALRANIGQKKSAEQSRAPFRATPRTVLPAAQARSPPLKEKQTPTCSRFACGGLSAEGLIPSQAPLAFSSFGTACRRPAVSSSATAETRRAHGFLSAK
mmetsp:Transcript_5079/g.12379  ORF Transcript_5079/g.12379 Transcript_5079/m.12379 type:complete len:579 (-) Transcript_5079:1057-2793(-)